MEEQNDIKESVTLTKNAKGDYQWIIKVKDDVISSVTLKRLHETNVKLEETYGKK